MSFRRVAEEEEEEEEEEEIEWPVCDVTASRDRAPDNPSFPPGCMQIVTSWPREGSTQEGNPSRQATPTQLETFPGDKLTRFRLIVDGHVTPWK